MKGKTFLCAVVLVLISAVFVLAAAQKEAAESTTTKVLMDKPAGPGERPLAPRHAGGCS